MTKRQVKDRPKSMDNQRNRKSSKIGKENRYFDLAGLSIVIFLGIIIYSNSINCSFHFDDIPHIVNNPNIRDIFDIKSWWNYSPNRPVAIFTFAVNYHFNQLDVKSWHLVNIGIHLINSILVWWISTLILSCPSLKDQKIVKNKRSIALLVALLFVSHPLATQSVTYIVQRMTSLVAMFYLLSVFFYIKGRLLSSSGGISKYILFASSIISGVLGMLTKENAFTLPIMILLIEFSFFQTKAIKINFKDYKTILIIIFILAFVLIIPLKVGTGIFKTLPPSEGHLYSLTPYTYLLTQFSVIVKYIALLLFPFKQIFDYDYTISKSFFEIRTLVSFIVLLSLFVVALYFFKKHRLIAFGIFWFLLTLSIESSIIPINDVIVEHRTYLPSFGFFLVFCSLLFTLLQEKNKNVLLFIITLIILSNSYLTFQRNKIWEDDLTFWNDNVEKTPNFSRPLTNRGIQYGQRGQYEKAFNDFSKAIKINPNYHQAYSNRGTIYGMLKQWENAIADYSKAIQIKPDFRDAYVNRSSAYLELKEWEKAIEDNTTAIALDSVHAPAFLNRSIAYFGMSEFEKAIKDATKSIELNPKESKAYYYRGLAYGGLEKWDKETADYSSMISINPKDANAYYARGNGFKNLKDWDKAISDYSSAIRLNPRFKEAYLNRGVVFGSLAQWDKAYEDFTKALEIDPSFALAASNRNFAYNYMNLGK